MTNEIEKFLRTNRYSLHLYWHASNQEWQALVRDAQGVSVASSYDGELEAAITVATLRAIDVTLHAAIQISA